MRKLKILSVALALPMMLGFAACGSSGTTATLTFTDADDFVGTALPYAATGGDAYAFNMMSISQVTITFTTDGKTYTFESHDVGNTDPSNGMYWDRDIKFTGNVTSVNGGVYALAAPTKVTEVLKYGTGFADYSQIWGDQGTYTEADATGQALLAQFVPCNATVTGSGSSATVTFDCPLAVPQNPGDGQPTDSATTGG